MTKQQSLEMPARPAKWVNINTRHEKHGDSNVLCADISVRGFHIDEVELNHFLGAKAHNALFNAASKGKPAEPMFRNVDPLIVWDEFDGCDVTFTLGLTDQEIDFEDAFISRIKLDPQVGGMTLMECLVSVEIDDTDDVARMLEAMGDESSVQLTIGAKYIPKGKKAQQSLDLAAPQQRTADEEQPSTH